MDWKFWVAALLAAVFADVALAGSGGATTEWTHPVTYISVDIPVEWRYAETSIGETLLFTRDDNRWRATLDCTREPAVSFADYVDAAPLKYGYVLWAGALRRMIEPEVDYIWHIDGLTHIGENPVELLAVELDTTFCTLFYEADKNDARPDITDPVLTKALFDSASPIAFEPDNNDLEWLGLKVEPTP